MKIQSSSFYSIFITFVISILVLIPSVSNFKYNDHSKNWLNHDYGKNLLSSTQEYSVFMTEGGDNQVFSSLYFTYAEKLRQDLFPYDQKGNIFKRIYGDLRYVTSDILEQRTKIVDQGLFTGQEPFYSEIRSSRPPYLVPYALGAPTTYLTWQRPNQHELGDFYYKNYGLMYKVQKIPYAIVDYVQPLKTTTLNAVSNYLNEKLGRSITSAEITQWSDQMVMEGYISRNRDDISYIKDYPKPFVKDPKESFIIRWNEIENLRYYDYLSREIVNSYAYEQMNLLAAQIEDLQTALINEKSETIKQEITTKIDKYWDELQQNIQIIKKVGYDSSATLHNVGIFYLSANDRYSFLKEDLFPEAITWWELAIKSAPYAWASYNLLLWAYLRQSFVDLEKSELYLKKFDEIHVQLKKNLSHWNSMKKNIEKSQPYQQSAQLFDVREQFDTFAGPQLLKEQETISSMLDGTVDFNLKMIQDYFGKMVNQLSFIGQTEVGDRFFILWKQLLKKYASNEKFLEWHVGLVGELTAYKNVVDESIFIETLKTVPPFIPSANNTTEEKLPFFIHLFRIAIVIQDQQYITQYKTMLLQRAKILLPEDQFISIKAQIDQLG